MHDTQPTVFVVDDDPSTRDALEQLFRSVGLSAKYFTSTKELLENPRPNYPCCLVLEVLIGGQSGLEFQRQITGTPNEIPIVFLTGHGDIAMAVQAMKADAIEFLTKPFQGQDLLDAIELGFERDRA